MGVAPQSHPELNASSAPVRATAQGARAQEGIDSPHYTARVRLASGEGALCYLPGP
jgi:hypothetical protein